MARISNRALWTAHVRGENQHEDASVRALGVCSPFDGYVLGIDPSVRGTGLALLFFKKGVPSLVQSHTLKFSATYSFADCLGQIFKAVSDVVKDYPSGHAALETTVYVQNFQIAHKLGAARGAAIAAANIKDWDIYEYAPLRIKQATVGSGRASKEQVAATMAQHLAIKTPLPQDEADAAAAALCHAWTFRSSATQFK